MSVEKDTHWATDDNYPAGAQPWSGTPTKNEPSLQKKDTGNTPETPWSAQEANWQLHYMNKELVRLDAMVSNNPALNFSEPVDIDLRIRHIRFDPYKQEWMAAGPTVSNAPSFARTKDMNTWVIAASEITDTSFPTAQISDFAPSELVGDVVGILAIDSFIDAVWRYDGAAWSAVITGELGDDPGSPPHVVWDTTSSQWIIACRKIGGSAPYVQVWTSLDGLTFTPQTAPSGVLSTVVGVSLATDGAGVLWMQIFTSGGSVQFSKSINGGLSWSACTTIAGVVSTDLTSASSFPKPAYDGTTWGAIVQDADNDACSILRLTAGGSWELVNTYNGTLCIASLAAHRGAQSWAGLTVDGDIVISEDSLATFKNTDFSIASSIYSPFSFTGKELYCNDVRFVATGRSSASTNTKVWFSGGAGRGVRTIPLT